MIGRLFHLLVLLQLTFVSGGAFADSNFVPTSGPIKLVDSSDNFYTYAYAPSIIQADGVYHAYFCSAGTGVGDWDRVRHATSTNLVNWSRADELLRPSAFERASCDPSVVRFNAGDGDYYYMMYSGNVVNMQTVNFLARSVSPYGPFLRLTQRGTWEAFPSDARIMTAPQRPTTDATIYGAGQPSLVVIGREVYQYYTDSTTMTPQRLALFLRKSTNMIDWSAPQEVMKDVATVDVKYDDAKQQFLMFDIRNNHQASSAMTFRASKDGLNFGDAQTICDENCFPNFAHNPGVSGSATGHLLEGQPLLVAFGAPYDAAAFDTWARWDLFGMTFKMEDSREIKGYVDSVKNDLISGWACAQTIESSIDVHVYLGGAAGQGGSMVAAARADRQNESGIREACGVARGNFRFSIKITDDMKSRFGGKGVFVHGISPVGRANSLLRNSGQFTIPKAVVQPPPPPPLNRDVVGVLDGIRNDRLVGWACARNVGQSISVQLSVGPNENNTEAFAKVSANRTSEAAVAARCEVSGAFRFELELTDTLKRKFGGRKIFAKGLSPVGLANRMLSKSGGVTMPSLPAPPTPTTPTPPEPPVQPDLAVHRFYMPRTGEHFLTKSYSEGIGAGYKYEGVAFKTFAKPAAGLQAIYRCYIPAAGMHFVSTMSNCEGLVQEGNLGFVHTAPAAGRRAIVRLYQPWIGDHLTTTNDREGSTVGYVREGIQGYVIAP